MLWRFEDFCEVIRLMIYLVVCGGNVSALRSCKLERVGKRDAKDVYRSGVMVVAESSVGHVVCFDRMV